MNEKKVAKNFPKDSSKKLNTSQKKSKKITSQIILNNQNNKNLEIMGHIVGGYPNKSTSIKLAKVILESGAKILEVQFPFSDGNADGESIQEASLTSINNGFCTKDGFEIIANIASDAASKNKKILAMTYANIVFNYGIENFIKDLKDAGGSGIIIPDFSYGENDFNIRKICKNQKIDFVELITPLSSLQRIKKIVKNTGCDFLYTVARNGITGQSTIFDDKTMNYIDSVKKICDKYNKKLMLGFGINSPEQILSIKDRVDGVIIGSYFVNKIKEGLKLEELKKISSLELHLQDAFKSLINY